MPSATPPDPTKRKRGRPRKWTGVPDGREACGCLATLGDLGDEPDMARIVLVKGVKLGGQPAFASKGCAVCHGEGVVAARPPEPARCSCGLLLGADDGQCAGPPPDAIDLKHLTPRERHRAARHGYQGKAWKDVACSACNGLGSVSLETDLECQHCGGSGRVEDELRIAAEAHAANPGDEAGEDDELASPLTADERKTLAQLAAVPSTVVHDGATTVHEAFDAEIRAAVRETRAWELFRESWTSGRNDADQLAVRAFAAVDVFLRAGKDGAK